MKQSGTHGRKETGGPKAESLTSGMRTNARTGSEQFCRVGTRRLGVNTAEARSPQIFPISNGPTRDRGLRVQA